jgi:hypothetical protein
VRERRDEGKSIAQRSQRGIGVGWVEGSLVNMVVPCGKEAKRGKHRTEVTEGNWGWMGRGTAGEHGGSMRERREEGKASHGGHRGGKFESGWSEGPLVNMVDSARERSEERESIAQRSQRGKFGVGWVEGPLVNMMGSVRERREEGKSIALRSQRRRILGWPRSSGHLLIEARRVTHSSPPNRSRPRPRSEC